MKIFKINSAFLLLVICNAVFCYSNTQNNTNTNLILEWPIGQVYSLDNYTNTLFPEWRRDKFVISDYYLLNPDCGQCNQNPFSLSKTRLIDYKYLSHYMFNQRKSFNQALQSSYENSVCCKNESQAQFFYDLVNLHQKFDVLKALECKNIVPSKTITYSSSQISDVLKTLFRGHNVLMGCKSLNPTSKDHDTYLKAGYFNYLSIVRDGSYLKENEDGYMNDSLCNKYDTLYFLPL